MCHAVLNFGVFVNLPKELPMNKRTPPFVEFPDVVFDGWYVSGKEHRDSLPQLVANFSVVIASRGEKGFQNGGKICRFARPAKYLLVIFIMLQFGEQQAGDEEPPVLLIPAC